MGKRERVCVWVSVLYDNLINMHATARLWAIRVNVSHVFPFICLCSSGCRYFLFIFLDRLYICVRVLSTICILSLWIPKVFHYFGLVLKVNRMAGEFVWWVNTIPYDFMRLKINRYAMCASKSNGFYTP